MRAYDFLNEHLESDKKRSFLDPEDMLELNAIVHLGRDINNRAQYEGFLAETRDKFNKYFPYLKQWYKRHEQENDDPYKIAAGIYVRILAAPQLFSDGNHRTGALLANYYLMKKGLEPFILTPENAVEFFNLASDIKFKKTDLSSKFKRAIGWRDEMQAMRTFLKENARPYATKTLKTWENAELKPAKSSPKATPKPAK
jgi:prophage maintenance system killer protein